MKRRIYPPDTLKRIFEAARRLDVEAGGRYDARSAAIIVWSNDWTTPENRQQSEPIGTIYVDWTAHAITHIDADPPFTEADILHELAQLEQAAANRPRG